MTLTSTSHSEKRDFIRMRIDADITLVHAEQVISAVCVDLSSSGLQVDAPQRFEVGDRIEVHLESEHAALQDLRASTEVVWIADQPEGRQTFGLRILQMQ